MAMTHRQAMPERWQPWCRRTGGLVGFNTSDCRLHSQSTQFCQWDGCDTDISPLCPFLTVMFFKQSIGLFRTDADEGCQRAPSVRDASRQAALLMVGCLPHILRHLVIACLLAGGSRQCHPDNHQQPHQPPFSEQSFSFH